MQEKLETVKMVFEKFTVEKPAVTYEEDSIYIDNGSLTISPTEIEVRCIGRTSKVPGYVLSIVKYLPASYWEPEDVDIVAVKESRNFNEVLAEAVKVWVGQRVESYLEAEGLAQQNMEWNSGEIDF